MTLSKRLDEAELRGMAFALGVHPDDIEATFRDLAKTEALVEQALDLGVAFNIDDDLKVAFPKSMPPETQQRLRDAIAAKSMAVSWVIDARLNGVESAFASMFEEPEDF